MSFGLYLGGYVFAALVGAAFAGCYREWERMVTLKPLTWVGGVLLALLALAALLYVALGPIAAIAAIAPPEFSVGRLEEEDWVRRSQAQFGPIHVAGRLWIVPSWHQPPDPSAIVVRKCEVPLARSQWCR